MTETSDDERCEQWEKWLLATLREIKAENGLPLDTPGIYCRTCRLRVNHDEHNRLFCKCHDERPKVGETRENLDGWIW